MARTIQLNKEKRQSIIKTAVPNTSSTVFGNLVDKCQMHQPHHPNIEEEPAEDNGLGQEIQRIKIGPVGIWKLVLWTQIWNFWFHQPCAKKESNVMLYQMT